jgi:predicted permease
MSTLLQDLRFALRALRRSPGFAIVAVATLAIGIGANAAIFGVVRGLLLADMPFREPDRLVIVYGVSPARGVDRDVTSVANFLDWKAQSTSLELAAWDSTIQNLEGSQEPEAVTVSPVTANFFDILGVRPVLGQGFAPGDDGVDGKDLIVLSDAIWRLRFGADPNIVGTTVRLHDVPVEIVGVAPPELRYPDGAEIWRTMRWSADVAEQRGALFLPVIGRQKSGVTLEQANAELAAIASRLERDYPRSNTAWTARAYPMHDELVRGLRPAVLVLYAAVGFVLLIVCANVANLLLARAAGRKRELAVRTALGAGRARLVRQMLTESLVLSLAGSALGLLLAVWGGALLRAAAPDDLPAWVSIGLDAPVLLYVMATAVATGILFGLVPALQSVRPPARDLGSGARDAGAGTRARGAFVALQVGLALVLLVGAGLMLRSLANLLNAPLGFRPEGILTARFQLPPTWEEDARVQEHHDRLLAAVRAHPRVRAAASSMTLPLSNNYNDIGFTVDGEPEPTPENRPVAGRDSVSPGYFRTMGIPFVAPGSRDFDARDHREAPRVAIINEAMARKHWPGINPVGKTFSRRDRKFTIIGVVGSVRRFDLRQEERPHHYLPDAQLPTRLKHFVLKVDGDPASFAGELQNIAAAVNPTVPLSRIEPLADAIHRSAAAARFVAGLLAVFAAIAVGLSALGLYGVLSYLVAQRRREIGVRMAVGARPADIAALIGRRGLTMAGLGVGLGLLGALALTRLLSTLLYDVRPHDPATLAGVSVLLLAVALGSSALPARRAARVDPMKALREE